jgi:hypothetical protein
MTLVLAAFIFVQLNGISPLHVVDNAKLAIF